MKNVLFSVFFSIAMSVNCLAQLKVKSNGNVGVGTSTPFSRLEVVDIYKTTEVRVYSASPNIARFWAANSLYSYGFGVDQYGIGQIYQNLNNPSSIMTFANGSVGINYSPGSAYKLYVGGSAYCTSLWKTSDLRFKEDVNPIDSALSKIMLVNGKTFRFINDQKRSQSNREYGFIAQDIKEIFPDLVQEVDDSIRSLAVNYDGFIPILVEAFKQQQVTIDRLMQDIAFLKEKLDLGSNIILDSKVIMYQNTPNPFNNKTVIKYSISEKYNNAMINVYNMQGLQIKCYKLYEADSELIINATDYKPGLYLYVMILDGREVMTKKMIITD